MENPEFRILHLYHVLMNLYGDWANTAILARDINERGYDAVIDRKSVGDDVDLRRYCFIYIGSGTELSLRACMRDIARFKDTLMGCIEEGVCVLATGNSHELFGRAVTDACGDRYETLGLLDFETIATDTRVTGDSVFSAQFLPDKLIGFINRAGHGQDGDIDRPFIAELGPGANDSSRSEGIKYRNLLGTYLTGPVLVRNPPLLHYFADILITQHISPEGRRRAAQGSPTAHGPAVPQEGITPGSGYGTPNPRRDEVLFASQEAAYSMALSELSARIKPISSS